MKLTAKTDLEVPAAFVFATLVDHPSWERDAVRNGAEVERPPGTPATGLGAAWRVRGQFRGKVRKVQLTITELVENQRVVLTMDGPTIEGSARFEVMVLSPRRSRLRVDVEFKPKTLSARLFINTMRLAKGRVQAKFEARLGQIGGRIKDRYERSQVQA
ncbi:MAG: SRPBCC family protein [Tabrizicola sp.]|uniref:SRPBCC family protein n=1 Tax=Tabrizicola sp. TaxID=2005166 RepID=UPI002ABC3CF8|nr:SRPBCC family protein [Tabrizicola sp.]MDZ4088637.1 SRPBCC family protein [Tabrizicola sp.]